MKVRMAPTLDDFRYEESGIKRVLEYYYKYLPKYGVELVGKNDPYDILASHAATVDNPDVLHTHGLYWTADYNAALWEWAVNNIIANAARHARVITVPSEWVAETFRRDMHINPVVIPHGIEINKWTPKPPSDYILWNKNRDVDVCDPWAIEGLAKAFPNRFITTFAPKPKMSQTLPDNIVTVDIQKHKDMKDLLQSASVYLSTTKETFGIGTLEAMACGVPVLGFAHGGNLETIQHCVNGYLAKPGDIDDLITGLDYCLKHRDILGRNGRELASKWSWDYAVGIVAGVYRTAMEVEKPTVSVTIPCYNYSASVGRAIQSVVEQDCNIVSETTTLEDGNEQIVNIRDHALISEITIVDDGSNPEEEVKIRNIVNSFADKNGSEFSITINNKTMNFQHVTVNLIRQDNAGVAIARNTGVSAGSGKYACCLDSDDAIDPKFIRTCVDALEEDRLLGVAYTALRWIKPDGSTGISEWPGDFNYDEQIKKKNQIPTCAVYRKEAWRRTGGYRQRYAPFGAGTEDAEFWLRLGSLGYNAKRVTAEPLFIYSWESGITATTENYTEVDWTSWHPWVWNDSGHPFASIASPTGRSHPVNQYDQPTISVIIPVGQGHQKHIINALDSLESQTFRKWEVIVVNDSIEKFTDYTRNAFPFAKFIELDGGKSVGPGAARNKGVKLAKAPFVIFLDADDYLQPFALERMIAEWGKSNSIIYTDYVGIAHVEDVSKLARNLQDNIIYRHGTKTVIGHRAADYDCARAVKQPFELTNGHPYIWCNVTALIPVLWHNEIGGFDEQLWSWEDVDYHWRMAKAGKCYTRVQEELLVYNFTTGTRRQTGLHDFPKLLEYLSDKHKEIKVAGCGCSKASSKKSVLGESEVDDMSDKDFEMIIYTHPNTGDHKVVGMATSRKYGHKSKGDTFLVHKADIAVQPNYFKIIIPEAPPVQETLVVEPSTLEPEDLIKEIAPPTAIAELSDSTEIAIPSDEFKDFIGNIYYNRLCKVCGEMGIVSMSELSSLSYDDLIAIKGVGPTLASKIIAWKH